MIPTELETERLRLRPFTLDDAPAVQAMLSDPQVSGTLMDIVHPFTVSDAQEMIAASQDEALRGMAYRFGIERKSDHLLVGYCDIEIHRAHERGEIAFWLGRPYWWQGYATEAARKLVEFGFDTLKLYRVYAHCLVRNEASAKVLQKAGLLHEGVHRQAAPVDDHFEDVAFYGLTQPART